MMIINNETRLFYDIFVETELKINPDA